MRDVAELAGVSVKTVSNVVNDYPHISPRTRAKVELAIQKLGYQVNPSAQSLRSGRTGVVGLAVPDLTLPYFGELAQRVVRSAEEFGLSVLIEVTESDRERELEVLSDPRRRLTDGLLFSPVAIGQDDVAALEVPYPLVLLGERVFGAPVDHVTMANVDGAYGATKYLYERGARRIAVVGCKKSEAVGSAALRVEGYLRAVRELGLPQNPELLLSTKEWSRGDGAEAVGRAVDAGVEFDAVFGLNDILAIGALHALHSRGLDVPSFAQVIGFDNIEEASFSSPPLTTVDPQVDRIVEDALSMLVRQIEQPSDRRFKLVVEGYSIRERGSTLPT